MLQVLIGKISTQPYTHYSYSICLGSISVSGQLPTYPSPNPTLTLTCCQLTVVELGEGWVGNCPDTDIDPLFGGKKGEND